MTTTTQPSPTDRAAWNTWRRENPNTRADLYRAYLSGADLYGANLTGANLSRADLSRANLTGANLYGANLSRADLSDADLYGANLYGANLTDARLNWNSHDLLSAILSRAASDDYDRRALAGAILVSRDWCWDTWIALPLWTQRPDLLAWARESLAPYARREDMAAEAYAFVTGQEVQS